MRRSTRERCTSYLHMRAHEVTCKHDKTGGNRGNRDGLSPKSRVCSPVLTDTACKNALCPPEKARVRLADAAGLYLEGTPNGAKRWFWKDVRTGCAR